MVAFFDTNFLLENYQELNKYTHVYISDVTLRELEDIKTSARKSEDIKYQARKAVRFLVENPSDYTSVIYTKNDIIKDYDYLDLSIPDHRIIVCALSIRDNLPQDFSNEDFVFCTNDLTCRVMAEAVGLKTTFVEEKDIDNYCGYKIINYITPEEVSSFYNDTYYNNKNIYDLLENEYLIANYEGENLGTFKWTKEGYKEIFNKDLKSKMFGKIAPYNNDVYQRIAIDSMLNNQLTVLRGPAGSGKSMISLGYLFRELNVGNIDRIVIFCNPVATRGAARLGFYPGSRLDKLLDSQIGNFLLGKFGGDSEIKRLINEEKLVLLPMSDIRGYEVPNYSGLYITEAQNFNIDLMKLALQRIGSNSVCVLDGDDQAQVDMADYGGKNNGLRRVSEIFRGEDYYGEVKLQRIYRSKIAEKAQNM